MHFVYYYESRLMHIVMTMSHIPWSSEVWLYLLQEFHGWTCDKAKREKKESCKTYLDACNIAAS